MPKSPTQLVWIDLETTGIDDRTCRILEIATIVTDKDLNTVEEGPDLVIHQPDDVLATMDPWCIAQHGSSGLTEASRVSTVSLEDAEKQTLAFVKKHCLKGKAPMCGNSIAFDRRFIMHHMPQLNRYLNYRNVDVSSVKELAFRWYPQAIANIAKVSAHRALGDIRQSIEELRYYREHVFQARSSC